MGILGFIFGLLAVAGAVFLTFLFGTVGCVIVGVLALVAFILGIVKRKKDGKGGISSIVVGVVAVILAFILTGLWSNMFSELHEKALEYKPDGLWAQAPDDVDHGLMGVVSQLPMDDDSMNAFIEEMNELVAYTGTQE